MQKRVKIVYTDGRPGVEVLASPRAQVDTERKFGCSLDQMNRMEQVYYLAWAALRHKGMESGDYETFLSSVDEISEAISNQDEADKQQHNPTLAALPSDESSKSA